MVRELERTNQTSQFPETAPAANPVFFRTYSRRQPNGKRESWAEVCDRTLKGLVKLGKLTDAEVAVLAKMQQQMKALPSGRWLWVGGTEWIEKPENFSGAYNCTSTNVTDWRAFGLMMDLAMMGCGTGAVLEPQYINQLPPIRNRLNVSITGEIGITPAIERRENTEIQIVGNNITMHVGDSRQGWVKSYQTLLELSSNEQFAGEVNVRIDLRNVRPAGELLKGFGGVANPIKLPELYQRCAAILNKAVGRQLNSVECCLLIDEAAVVVVAGNVRRSAGMRQGDSNDELFANAKSNLWQQDENGNWRIDPERDALRMANHTRVFHRQPTLDECITAVRNQYYSGEGAIQYAPEAIARANADILTTPELKSEFLQAYTQGKEQAQQWLCDRYSEFSPEEIEHRLSRYGLNPCVTAETWIHTGEGPKQVKDLIGVQHSTYVNGELFSTTPQGFFFTGVKPVVKVQTQEGYSLRLTENHQLLKVTAQTQKNQYTEWVAARELKSGDRILIHNHRGLTPWEGTGTQEEGWLIGNLISDGCFKVNPKNYCHQTSLRAWDDAQETTRNYALDVVKNAVLCSTELTEIHYQNKDFEINSTELAKLAGDRHITSDKTITPTIEQASFEFYRGFLRGLFDADGSIQESQFQGVSVRLAQSNLQLLEAVQRMLLRLGIASCIYQNRRTVGARLTLDSQRPLAEYFCKDGLQHGEETSPSSPPQHELVIANDNICVFQELIGFQEPTKAARLEQFLSGDKRKFNCERFAVTVLSIEPDGEEAVYDCTVPSAARFDANGLVAHNCGEIIGANFHCNLSEIHLNQIDPNNEREQQEAFTAGALSVATLLNHKFIEPRYQESRELDPIVGVSFTGLFDFFVRAFGVEWLRWWTAGRPATPQGLEYKQKEQEYLSRWKDIVHQVIWEYCDRHNIKCPNRCTTVQPSGTKSLLTGASPGWHPPKAQRFIRRITFRKNDPVALACIDYGYNVVPSQSDKDENGNLLNDPFDPRCTEWLVEIPVAVSWADLPGADEIDISQFSATSQMDFYMQVQKHYVSHNTSATIELRENEVEALGTRIYEAINHNEGYISAALLARFDAHQTFPRLPFEPISKQQYDELMQQVKTRRRTHDFQSALMQYDAKDLSEVGPAGCDSDKCLFSEQKPV
ncbi:ribonucleoside-triphosphate reductase, adenosylcobalamin-dependent [Chroococcidiopsis sp. TS-821]|uniref:ribonucleoside-triphosphate reductase, adenosylcobalamin-dependent n=1 Tax=Chroococcidiopsis sp. TS-821 TaxID=1378066 RepID=UPI000CEE3E0D|nr:ribonucleoside-triphosphate reductase, adenosylcobalamin-dependent [Chroococcidiopsis sp. TS-821]PPS43277.1 response regulator SirA [Chroococcidiopsis sp. TS-821]